MKTKSILDELDEEFKRTLMRLYIERQPLHEFTTLLAEALDRGQIVIPMRRERRPENQDQPLEDSDR